jgi:hypothetical protein
MCISKAKTVSIRGNQNTPVKKNWKAKKSKQQKQKKNMYRRCI